MLIAAGGGEGFPKNKIKIGFSCIPYQITEMCNFENKSHLIPFLGTRAYVQKCKHFTEHLYMKGFQKNLGKQLNKLTLVTAFVKYMHSVSQ